MTAEAKKKLNTAISIEKWEKLDQEIFRKNRTNANSECHMRNFSLSDTASYLECVNRKDIDPEKLYLALNRAILARDLMMEEIITGERCSAKFDKSFKEDLSDIIKHTSKLCAILGIDENDEIKINWSGKKAFYPNSKRKEEKPKRKDNLYWGLSTMAFGHTKWAIPSEVLKRARGENPFSFPFFANHLQDIARDINFLRIVAKNMQKELQNDRAVMDSDYYNKGISFGLTPDQWIIGRKLPEIYRESFSKEPQIARERGDENTEPYGEGIDFIMWCLEKMGISLSKETVTKYYYKYRIVPDAEKSQSVPM